MARIFCRSINGHRAFVIPNPCDAGTARLLAGLGFEALASATDVPVSADPENGYGDDPDTVAAI